MIDGERTEAPLQSEAEEKQGVSRVARMPGLVDSLAGAPPEDKPPLAHELNELLIAMRAPGQEAAEAAVVLAALNEHKLDGAVDEAGRSCRKEAVETLLATGFPHALQVSPEDLSFARTWRPKRNAQTEWAQRLQANRTGGAWAAMAFALVTLGAELSPLGGTFDTWQAVSIAAALLVAVAAFWLSKRPPDTRDQAPFGTAIAVGAVVQLICMLAIGPLPLLGAAGAVLALVLAFGSQYVPDPNGY